MGERVRYELATSTAELMYNILEAEYGENDGDLDGMMKRFKDLSAYSLTHAEIMDQREGPELLALGMFFGITSNPSFRKNQERIGLLSDESLDYQGQPEIIEQDVSNRKRNKFQSKNDDETTPSQPRLF